MGVRSERVVWGRRAVKGVWSEKDVRAVRYVWGGRIVKGLLKAIERFAWSWESHSYSEEFCCSTRQSSVLRLE